MGASLQDFLRQFIAQLVFERRDFFLQLFLELFHFVSG